MAVLTSRPRCLRTPGGWLTFAIRCSREVLRLSPQNLTDFARSRGQRTRTAPGIAEVSILDGRGPVLARSLFVHSPRFGVDGSRAIRGGGTCSAGVTLRCDVRHHRMNAFRVLIIEPGPCTDLRQSEMRFLRTSGEGIVVPLNHVDLRGYDPT